MLLTVTTTHEPATDLGYLLVKHPDRVHAFVVPTGTATVCFPEASARRCTAALLLEVDPLRLSTRRGGRATAMPEGFTLGQHVNDRPYAASSLLAAALNRAFRSAMRGECQERPELAATAIPLEVRVPVVRGGAVAAALFEPLGWRVDTTPVPLDETQPGWGASRYVELTLTGTQRVADALNHLYVLLPVLDDAKHYWVAPDEVDKLLRAGGGWLSTHPAKELITRRYLSHRRALAGDALLALAERAAPDGPDRAPDGPERVPAGPAADEPAPSPAGRPLPALDAEAVGGGSGADVLLARLAEAGDEVVPDSVDAVPESAVDEDAELPRGAAGAPAPVDGPEPVTAADTGVAVPLAVQRREAVLAALAERAPARILDLGCGAGALLAELMKVPAYTELVGVDVAPRALELAERRLRLDRLPSRRRGRVRLLQSALTYADDRLVGFDAAVLMEVIEHVDPPRLPALAASVFGHAHPSTVVITTPNVEYNRRYEGMGEGALRHHDHRFEWTRKQFARWCADVAVAFGYAVVIRGVGTADPELGSPTQLGLFCRVDGGGPSASARSERQRAPQPASGGWRM